VSKFTPLMLLAFGAGLAFAPRAAAQAREVQLLVVARKTPLVQYGGGRHAVATLQPHDLLRSTPTTFSAPRHMHHVVVVDVRKVPLVGWVDTRDCHNLYTGSLQRPSWRPSPIPTEEYPPVVPVLIRRAPERVQQAYKDLEATIKLNEKLKLPEPYFLRARLWAQVKNYDAALRDYLTAASYISNGRLDPVSYARYFEELKAALDGLKARPRSLDAATAEYHFYRGKEAFATGDFAGALLYFEDAVQLGASEPLYWYYRGVTNRQLGKRQQAVYDVRVGSHLEYLQARQGKGGKYILDGLERVQGPLRTWWRQVRNRDHKVR
jgi:hypothetical protein